MASDPGLFETMYQLRAMRRLKPDPVPEELIWKLVEAGTKAPSGSNSQVWRFVVVRDPESKRFIQERYKRAWDRYAQANLQAAAVDLLSAEELRRRMRMGAAALYLTDHLHEAPVLLLVCMMPRPELTLPAYGAPIAASIYASIFPAVQNILLAARALGLGSVLTTLHLLYQDDLKKRFDIPASVETVALLPIGYPKGRFGPTTRIPVDQVTYWERWGSMRGREQAEP